MPAPAAPYSTGRRSPFGSPDSLRDYRTNGSAFVRETMPRAYVTSNALASPGTGVMLSVAMPFEAGEVVTNLTFRSGSTAANGPTHWWFALYSSAATPALLAQTADQASAAWGANGIKTLPLSAAQTIPSSGIYYVSCMMSFSTAGVTFAGINVNNTMSALVVTGQAILAQTSGSGLTTTAPATIASPTTVATMAYAVAT